MSTTASLPLLDRARRRPRLAATLCVAAIVVVSALVRIALASNVAGPWIFVDELIYSELGRTAFSGFAIRGVPVSGYGNVYPFVIAPAYWLFENLVTAYAAVKVTNAIVMSLTAIPVYFLARTLVGRRWALVASGLSVLVPGMAYTGMVMTENAFYPAFALATLLVVLALQRRTLIPQVLVFAAAFLCFEVRPQGAVIVPAYVVGAFLLVLLDGLLADDGDRVRTLMRRLREFVATWAIAAAAVVGGWLYLRSRGVGIGSLLGAYSIAAEQRDRYQTKPIISWFLLHIAELELWLGVIPAVALLVLIGVALRRQTDPNLRAFACAAVPMILSMAALVAAFVVFSNVSRIEERNLFYVGLLPLVALCWWAHERFSRPQPRWFVVAVVVGAVGPIVIPYGALLTQSAVSDTFGIFLPYAVQSRLLDSTLTVFVMVLVSIGAVVLLVFAGPRFGWIVVVGVACFMALTAGAVDRRTDKASASAVAISAPQDWVDRSTDPNADVSVVFSGGAEPMRVWQAEFFNRSIRRVLTLGAPLAGGLPDTVVDLKASGAVVDRAGAPVRSGLVLTDALTAVEGDVVARDLRYGMVLYRTHGQLRVLGAAQGLYGDGWTGGDVIYTRYWCGGGTVTMEASVNASIHPDPVTVTPYVNDVAQAPVAVSAAVGSVPIPASVTPNGDVCQVRFHVEPLVAPSDAIGSADTRPLGVIVRSFGYTPAG